MKFQNVSHANIALGIIRYTPSAEKVMLNWGAKSLWGVLKSGGRRDPVRHYRYQISVDSKTSIQWTPVVKFIAAILSVHQYSLGKTFFGQKNIWVKVFGKKNIWVEKILHRIFGQKEIRSENNLCQKMICWSKIIFRQKIKKCINYA